MSISSESWRAPFAKNVFLSFGYLSLRWLSKVPEQFRKNVKDKQDKAKSKKNEDVDDEVSSIDDG